MLTDLEPVVCCGLDFPERPALTPCAPYEACIDVKNLGKNRDTHALSVGRHEQTIAVLTSRLLQIDAKGLSQLTSVETEMA